MAANGSRERLTQVSQPGERLRVMVVQSLRGKGDVVVEKLLPLVHALMPELSPVENVCFRYAVVDCPGLGRLVLNIYVNPPGNRPDDVTSIFVFNGQS